MTAIETPRLLLRRLQPADLDNYPRVIYGDPDVMAMMPSGQTLTREAFEAYVTPFMVNHWDTHGFGPWIAIYKPDERLIGYCGLKFWPGAPNEVEVFYALDKHYWGRGLATEGARAALRYGFEQVGLGYIIGYALTPTPPPTGF